MPRPSRPALTLLGLLVLVAFAAPGCEQADPNSAEYWIAQLKEKKTKAAVQKLGDMKAKEGVDALIEAYADGRFRYDIVAALVQIGDQKAVPVLVEAIGDKQEKDAAKLAGATLLEWKAGEGNTDKLLPVIQDPGSPNENKYAALQLLAEYPDPKAAEALLAVVKADPDVQPIALAGLAAEGLGKLKYEKAIRPLITCMWLDDALGRNAVSECRLALGRIGPAALPEIVKTLERKNRIVEKRARKLKFDKGGIVEAKSAELLGDNPSPDSVDALIKALNTMEEMPPSVSANPQKAQAFVMGGVQKTISTAKALATIGDERAVEPLLAIAGGKELALEHKLAGVQQLGFLGSPKAVKGLHEMLQKEVNQYDPVSQGFRVQLALAISNIIDPADTKQLGKVEKTLAGIKKETNEWIADNEKKIPTVKGARLKQGLQQDIKGWQQQLKDFAEVEAKLAVVKACGADTACYAGKAGDENVGVQLLAAYRLAHAADGATAMPALVKRAGELLGGDKMSKDDPVVLNVIMFGIGRQGTKANVADLAKLIETAEGKAKTEKNQMFKGAYKGAAYTLNLLAASLSHRG